MKKIIVPVFLLLSLCMVGCSKNLGDTKYKCTYHGEEYDKGTMEIILKGEKVSKVTQKLSTTYDDEEELNNAYNSSQFEYGILGAIDGVSANVSKNGKTITITTETDIEKMSEDVLVGMLGTEDITKETFIKNAEEQGFICE